MPYFLVLRSDLQDRVSKDEAPIPSSQMRWPPSFETRFALLRMKAML